MGTTKNICAWCNTDLGLIEKSCSVNDITHGICSLCAIKLTNYEARTAEQILNCLREPVLVIDHEGIIKAANKSAQEMLGKDPTQIKDQLGGDVFECTYAGTEGGCGRTEHCKTCAIRNIIMDTLSTGHGYKNVPAFQSIQRNSQRQIIKFHISTKKIKDRIILRIDNVQ